MTDVDRMAAVICARCGLQSPQGVRASDGECPEALQDGETHDWEALGDDGDD